MCREQPVHVGRVRGRAGDGVRGGGWHGLSGDSARPCGGSRGEGGWAVERDAKPRSNSLAWS